MPSGFLCGRSPQPCPVGVRRVRAAVGAGVRWDIWAGLPDDLPAGRVAPGRPADVASGGRRRTCQNNRVRALLLRWCRCLGRWWRFALGTFCACPVRRAEGRVAGCTAGALVKNSTRKTRRTAPCGLDPACPFGSTYWGVSPAAFLVAGRAATVARFSITSPQGSPPAARSRRREGLRTFGCV